MNFPNFLIWQVYPSMVTLHGQYIFMCHDSAGKEKETILTTYPNSAS